MATNNAPSKQNIKQNNKEPGPKIWTWPFENWTDIFRGRTDDNPANEELYRMRESMSMLLIMISGIVFVWVSMKFYYAKKEQEEAEDKKGKKDAKDGKKDKKDAIYIYYM